MSKFLPEDSPVAATTSIAPDVKKALILEKESDFLSDKLINNASSFCVPWNVSSDEWWTHHPQWEVFHETEEHYCFRRILNQDKAKLFLRIHFQQFGGANCTGEVLTKQMWSSGWGADFLNVVDGLVHGQKVGLPFQLTKFPWHYARPKPFHEPAPEVCPSKDMFCYFLPLSKCEPQNKSNEVFWEPGINSNAVAIDIPGRWYLEYATRPQTWLRKRVFDFTKKYQIQQPCSVMHVRRADVVRHGEASRRYFAISEYFSAANSSGNLLENNILLLTDDHNAIGEALHVFPEKHWMYINRTRFRGNEGGWERQIPSNDPAQETVIILSIFRLAQKCSSIVRSESNFGSYVLGSMKNVNESALAIRVEDQYPNYKAKNANNSHSVNISKAYDNS